jgi:hypothetical protein
MQSGKIRLLFGCWGWPSGVLEVASWAVREGLADARIVQLPDRGDADDETAVREPDAAAQRPLAPGEADFLRHLAEFRPHVVGFRVEGGGFDRVRRWVGIVRASSDAEIILGGPTATSHPREVLEESDADYVFAGEAEESLALFLRLARQRDARDRLPDVPGMAYHYGGRVYHNTLPADGHGQTVLDVDGRLGPAERRRLHQLARPTPGVELVCANRLDWSLLQDFREPLDALYFTGGRGCPGVCSFCARLHGGAVRAKTAAQLLSEIEGADAAVAEGRLGVTRWRLFERVSDASLRGREVAWAAVYDEDFFLARRRAVEFFRLWKRSPLRNRYRLSVQTNPCSLLRGGRIDRELIEWIDRLKPMIQLGGESFHEEVLGRWRKRHTVGQLEAVLDALDATGQDYTLFHLLADFESTPEEVVDAVWLLARAAQRHPRMRIASSALVIPLFDSDVRRRMEYGGRLRPEWITGFADYERPHPEWMDPVAAELAERADSELQFALQPEHRDAAVRQAVEAVVECLRARRDDDSRAAYLLGRAEWGADVLREGWYRGPAPVALYPAGRKR